MSDTATPQSHKLHGEANLAAPPLVPPPKLRRRPTIVAGAIAAVCLGAVLAAWAWSSSTSTQQVLVATAEIPRGSVIEAEDLTTARLNVDSAVAVLPASAADDLIGQRAALDVAAGGLLTADLVQKGSIPASGKSLVGVALKPEQAPGETLMAGDLVRVVVTPGQDGETPKIAPEFSAAEVVGIHHDSETGQTVVDLLVPHAEASLLAARVATGNIALVLDSRDR
jgi:Flp pilus assembly protein CpaB